MAGKPRIDFPTAEHLAQIEALGAFLSIEQIAEYFGIGKTTFYRRCEENEEIMERYKKGRAKVIAKIAQGLINDALDGDNACRFFYLKTQAGWKETQVVDNKSSDGSMKVVTKIEIVAPELDEYGKAKD